MPVVNHPTHEHGIRDAQMDIITVQDMEKAIKRALTDLRKRRAVVLPAFPEEVA